jgi:PKD repeat protein
MYIRWDFGDGTHLEGTKNTSLSKNPVHKYKKTGFYITELTIRCGKYGKLLWVHKNVVIK